VAVEHKTVVLLIDEGQKLSADNLEILRTLLNYETNEYKLLQLVILSQLELLARIKKIKNFSDRIALSYVINPLNQEETKEMIEFRLAQAGYKSANGNWLFTDEAIRSVYEYSQGYPRKIAHICHDALEHIVMHQKPMVDAIVIQEIINQAGYGG
jgi:general secretion pathway protein A